MGCWGCCVLVVYNNKSHRLINWKMALHQRKQPKGRIVKFSVERYIFEESIKRGPSSRLLPMDGLMSGYLFLSPERVKFILRVLETWTLILKIGTRKKPEVWWWSSPHNRFCKPNIQLGNIRKAWVLDYCNFPSVIPGSTRSSSAGHINLVLLSLLFVVSKLSILILYIQDDRLQTVEGDITSLEFCREETGLRSSI